MNNKIDVSFLRKSNTQMDKVLEELDKANHREPLYKAVKKTVAKQQKDSSKVMKLVFTENDTLFIEYEYMPDVLVLRHDADYISKMAKREVGVFSNEFYSLLDEIFHSFDDFYETWVTNS